MQTLFLWPCRCIRETWGIRVINMHSDSKLNNVDENTYNLYMFGSIHPTKAGYLEWWTPYMENYPYKFGIDPFFL